MLLAEVLGDMYRPIGVAGAVHRDCARTLLVFGAVGYDAIRASEGMALLIHRLLRCHVVCYLSFFLVVMRMCV